MFSLGRVGVLCLLLLENPPYVQLRTCWCAGPFAIRESSLCSAEGVLVCWAFCY